jgi:tyrosyl-tRNA synthetase
VQTGGGDQWGNILAGVDLIRRVENAPAYGLVFPLLTTASGAKMGKTERGAVWLDAGRVSPYEYYQFWINVEDADVERFLALFTFLPMQRVQELGRLQGAEIRRAKEVLAFEATRITHGDDAAEEAQAASRALFGAGGDDAAIPTTALPPAELEAGIPAPELFHRVGLSRSRSQARRLIQQGGAYLNDEPVASVDTPISAADLVEGAILLRAGKKRYHRVIRSEP